MEAKVVWTRRSVKDIEKIAEYYVEKSPTAALKIIDKILDMERFFLSALFLDGPDQVTRSKKHIYRYFVEGNYKLIYYRKRNYVFIVSVFATRQNSLKLKL